MRLRWRPGLLWAGLVGASLAAAPTSAWACGALVSPNGQAEMSGFVALIAADGTSEDVVTSIRYIGAGTDFGWLLPLPAAPEITPANLGGIEAAAALTEPPHYTGCCPVLGGGAAAPAPTAVQELGRTVVGNLEFVTLRATGAGALGDWMAANGFAYHGEQGPSLDFYLNRGWVVVAARVTRQLSATGDSVGVHLRFPSSTPVYPLELAAGSHVSAVLRTTFYVVTPWRPLAQGLRQQVVRPDDQGFFNYPGDLLEMRYSAPLAAGDAAAVGASVTVPPGAWLTRYDSGWILEHLSADLVLQRSPDQSRVDFSALAARQDQARRRDNLIAFGLLGGVVLVLAGIPIAITVLAVVFLARRRG